jgi:hypothetical protein
MVATGPGADGLPHRSAHVPAGISGLGRGVDGSWWAVTERPATLVRLDVERLRAVEVLPLDGAPGVEPESVDGLPDGRLVIGTEAPGEGRSHDEVWIVRVGDGQATIEERWTLPWELFDLVPRGNQGIEGVCTAADQIWVAGEPVGQDAEGRWAPIARREGDGWVTSRLRLTSDTGKVSALACRRVSAGVELLAIERHYDVQRVLRVPVDDGGGPGGWLDPELVPLPGGTLEPSTNPEGLAFTDDGRFVVITDNQGRRVSGPTLWIDGPAL